jgi:hypothetical protein
MRKRMLLAAALAVALGGACVTVDRQAAGIYVAEPMVETGVFTRVGRQGEAWMFVPATPSVERVPVWVTPDTSVLVGGARVSLDAVEPGQTVRLVYELQRNGTGVAERIDIIGKVTGSEPPDAAF